MAVNFSGLSSGIDSKAIIEATAAAQRVPVQALQARQGGYTTEISDIGDLTSKLAALKTLSEDMQDTAGVLAFTATSSDEEVLTASVTGDVSAGDYAIHVTDLAVAEKDRSTAFTSRLDEVKAGILTITVAGYDPIDVTIEGGDTLADVVDRINVSGARVDASIVNNGTQSYLQLVAQESGHVIGEAADDAVTISEVYFGVDGTELGLTQVVQAKNAAFTIDGLPVEQRSNSVDTVLEGMRFELKKGGDVTLKLAGDHDGTKEKLTAFVTAVNDILASVRASMTDSEGNRRVDADSTFETVASELRGLVSSEVTDLIGTFTSVTDIGIVTNSSGDYEIDDARLETALARDMRAVGRLFTTADTGVGTRIADSVDKYTNGIDGILVNRKTSLNSRIADLDNEIARVEARVVRTTLALTMQFTAMERAISSYQLQGAALSGIFG